MHKESNWLLMTSFAWCAAGSRSGVGSSPARNGSRTTSSVALNGSVSGSGSRSSKVNTLGRMHAGSPQELPLVRQSRGNDCGPAALATVAAYHGCPFAYDDLADEIALDRWGTDLLTLTRVAKRRGFLAEGIKASYDDIPQCRLPAIAHIRRVGGGHFVVIYRWTPTHVIIGDPAVGVQTISRRAFRRRSTGYLLIIHPAPKSDSE